MGQREPGIIPAAEWGEKPRETVTVKPAASRISQIRKALLPDRCHHRGRLFVYLKKELDLHQMNLEKTK